uniref:G-protein coupled receptors family 1 profile domain-containing protein n=1 Tax=Heliothis virescens TaxID=7102 RepID=A0A2A4JWG3_HELVI
MYASTYVLVALSIDRCDAITNPMNFSGSWNRARALIVSAWLISIVFSIPLLILYEVKEVQGQMQCWIDLGTPRRWQIWMSLISIMIFVLPSLTIAACYAVIVLTIWTKSKAVVMSPPINSRRTKTLRNGQIESDPDSRRASSRGLIPRAKIKSVKMTFVIVFGQMQCWIDLGTPRRWQIWMSLISIMIFVLPSLTIAACYAVIVLTIWTKSKAVVMSPPINSRRTKTLRNGQIESDPDSRRASSRGLIPRAKIKSVKMTFVIVFVFVLCWSPYIVFDLLQVYQHIPPSETNFAIATLIQSLAPLNSAANPLICCMFSPHIYTSLRRVPPYKWLWCGRRRKRHARGTVRSRSDSTANSDLLSSTHGRRSHSVATILNRGRSSSVSRVPLDARRTQLLVLVPARD